MGRASFGKSMIYLFLLPLYLVASTLEQKVGELFVIPICPQREEAHWHEVKEVMEKYHISSVIVKQATPDEQLKMLEFLGPNVFVFQDAEWGLGMRMPGTQVFPKNGLLKEQKSIKSELPTHAKGDGMGFKRTIK